MLGNVPIKTAARLMQKSEMFVRMGLRCGRPQKLSRAG